MLLVFVLAATAVGMQGVVTRGGREAGDPWDTGTPSDLAAAVIMQGVVTRGGREAGHPGDTGIRWDLAATICKVSSFVEDARRETHGTLGPLQIWRPRYAGRASSSFLLKSNYFASSDLHPTSWGC